MRAYLRWLAVPVLAALVLAGCSSGEGKETAKRVAEKAFIASVNLKCKAYKTKAKLAWDIADELGAGNKAKELQASAKKRTDDLVAEIDRLDGPVDVRKQVNELLQQSATTLDEVSNGTLTPEEGKARLEELQQQAKDRGIGECVTS
jgi:thiamine biosynthesis lipoprotein ApbE